jgi:lipoprotein Spr
MKKLLSLLFLIWILTSIVSCKSVHKITDKDNSTSATNRKKTNRKIEFIDGIEITPGSVVKSKHKPATTKSKNDKIAVAQHIPTTSKMNIEKANQLQIKYALLLDTYIENITNTDLFLKIDEWWGTNYCMGGTTKDCIDCSGFTGNMMRDIYRINLPRTASEQYTATDRVNREDLKEGDLVFFKTKKGYVNHVGIYLCNNKFVHASTSNGVTITDLDERYWQGKYAGGGRVIQ